MVTLFGELQGLLHPGALFYLGTELTLHFVPLDGVAQDSSQLASVHLTLDEVVVRAFPDRSNSQLFILVPGNDHDACVLSHRHDSPQGLQAGSIGQSQVEQDYLAPGARLEGTYAFPKTGHMFERKSVTLVVFEHSLDQASVAQIVFD